MDRLVRSNLMAVKEKIKEAEQKYHRFCGSVQLMAVSKSQSIAKMKEAYDCGQLIFGESYVQEAQAKMKALATLPLQWHFIGAIQGNKTRTIAETFDWVHSISSLSHAQRFNTERPSYLSPLNICIQVNLDNEENKSGVRKEELVPLINAVNEFPRLSLRGLMCIPKPLEDPEEQYQSLLRLKTLFDQLNHQLNLSMDTLSMGMSKDMQAAIRAGSTMVRVGEAIFGKRQVLK